MLRNLLLTGGPGPGHDFEATATKIAAILSGIDEPLETTIVSDPSAAIDLLRSGERWDLLTVNALLWSMRDPRYAEHRAAHAFHLTPADGSVIGRHVESGSGLLALHTAMVSFDDDPTWRRLLGARWDWDRSGHAPLDATHGVDITPTNGGLVHPITAGIDPFEVIDEVYADLELTAEIEPLLVGFHDGRPQPLLWARPVGRGRVVVDLLGHGIESLDHPSHRTVLERSAAWALGRTR